MSRIITELHYTTRASLIRLLSTSQAGLGQQITAVEGGYLRRTETDRTSRTVHPTIVHAVRVCGAKGDVYFTGFGWGYGGEGARGLCHLLQYLGMDGVAARHYVMGCLVWDNVPAASSFPVGRQFLRVWQLKQTEWMAAHPRRDSVNTGIVTMAEYPIGVALDHILHRQLKQLRSRSDVAACVGCDRSYVSRIIRGQRQVTATLARQWITALASVPGMLTQDVDLLRAAFATAIHASEKRHAQTRQKRTSNVELKRTAEYRLEEISFLRSTDQRVPEPVAAGHQPIAVSMVTAALRANLALLAQTSDGCMINLVRDNSAVSRPRSRRPWIVEVRGGPRTSQDWADLEFTDPKLAATAFIERVGSWAAMNAVRERMLTAI